MNNARKKTSMPKKTSAHRQLFFCKGTLHNEDEPVPEPQPEQPVPEQPKQEQAKPEWHQSEQLESEQLEPEQAEPEQPEQVQPQSEQPELMAKISKLSLSGQNMILWVSKYALLAIIDESQKS